MRTRIVAVVAALALPVLVLLISGMTAESATAAGYLDCRVRGSEFGLADLKAKRITCRTARRVYRKSLRVAMRELERGHRSNKLSFRFRGRRWTCRARNPQREINGQYVHYVWTCKAQGGRVSRYRWLTGD